MLTAPTYMEDTGFLQQEVISANVILQRSTLVIGYCLVITVTFCSGFPHAPWIFNTHAPFYMDRDGHSDDLPHNDHNRDLRLPATERDRCHPNRDCVCLHPTTIHDAWGSRWVWYVHYLLLHRVNSSPNSRSCPRYRLLHVGGLAYDGLTSF